MSVVWEVSLLHPFRILSLLCTVWLSRNAPNQMPSSAVCAGSGKEGAAHLQNPLTQRLALKRKVFLDLQEHKKTFSHIHFE